jgi:hypothetical protein
MNFRIILFIVLISLSKSAIAQDEDDEIKFYKRQIGIGLGSVGIEMNGSRQKFIESPFFRGAGFLSQQSEFLRRNALPNFYFTNWFNKKTAVRIDVLGRSLKYIAPVFAISGVSINNAVVRNTNIEIVPSVLFNMKPFDHSKIYFGAGGGLFSYTDRVSDPISGINVNSVLNGLIYQGLAGYETKFGKRISASAEIKYMQRTSNNKDPNTIKINSQIIYPLGRFSVNYNF